VELSNILLLLVGLAAAALNPVCERLAPVIAGFFRRRQAAHEPFVAPDSAPCGCG